MGSMKLIPGIAVFFFIGVLALFIIAYLIINRDYQKNKKMPVKQVKAKLVKKQIDVVGHKNPDKDPKLNPTANIYYHVLFRTSSEVLEFDIKEDEYEKIKEGDKGILSYQGKWFTSFEIQ